MRTEDEDSTSNRDAKQDVLAILRRVVDVLTVPEIDDGAKS